MTAPKAKVKAPKVAGDPTKSTALDRLVADADSDMASAEVQLVGRRATVSIEIPPALDWGVEAYPALERGDFQGWAEAALSPEDFDLWQQASPTIRQALDVLKQWTEATGEDPGESSASQPS